MSLVYLKSTCISLQNFETKKECVLRLNLDKLGYVSKAVLMILNVTDTKSAAQTDAAMFVWNLNTSAKSVTSLTGRERNTISLPARHASVWVRGMALTPRASLAVK